MILYSSTNQIKVSMNPLSPTVEEGTFGELLVILRLLQYHVQAFFPLKDSGNDLIAIKDSRMKAIQVKSSIIEQWAAPEEGKKYDILALVSLKGGDETNLFLDQSTIYLLSKKEVGDKKSFSSIGWLEQFLLNDNRIKELFS